MLFDVPSENNIGDSGSEIDFIRNRRTLPLPSDLDTLVKKISEDLPIVHETSSWIKQDKIPVLEDFMRNPGMKQFPSDHISISEVVGLFFGNDFFEMLYHETNLYHHQTEYKWKEHLFV